MPKIIELTVEINIQKVSCPGVWLCQDGRVCLTVFALGTSYQTCLLPPAFPLLFKDVFYFKKRFQDACALHNICCLLKDETIYCELVQWLGNCTTGEYVILAQYLGALSNVLFPPNMCSTDGVDLLMRRTKEFPGILSPKIEIATKVRIDEVWDQPPSLMSPVKLNYCSCKPQKSPVEEPRQKQVCHTARFHRHKCNTMRSVSRSRSRSRSRSESGETSSVCSSPRRTQVIRPSCRDYCVYNVSAGTPSKGESNPSTWSRQGNDSDEDMRSSREKSPSPEKVDRGNQKRYSLESRYIDQDRPKYNTSVIKDKLKIYRNNKVVPCVCEICKRYHELFHTAEA